MGRPPAPFRSYQRIIRWAFERFYREFAWTYDTVAALVSWGYWPSWVRTTLPFLRGDVLELGCGTGYLQNALADLSAGRFVVGCDRSAQMIRRTKRRVGSAQVVQADVTALPIHDACFDTVVATFPTDYIAQPATLAEVRRLLRPGGQLVVLVGAQLAGDGLYAHLVALAYRLTLQQAPQRPATTKGHDLIDGYSAVLCQRMADAGFAVASRWVAAPGGSVAVIIAEVHPWHLV